MSAPELGDLGDLGDLGAVLLAGGRSSRMGRPKAWLEFGGRPLLTLLGERLAAAGAEVVVVAAPGQEVPPAPGRVARDEAPGEGPVAGLVVGLREVSRPAALVVSCDVPFLDLRFVRRLADRLPGYDVVVPEWEGRLQPLQAVYRPSVRPLLAEGLAAGRRRPVDLYDRVPTCIVPEAEVRRIVPDGLTFLNMNTPADYRRALELWAERQL